MSKLIGDKSFYKKVLTIALPIMVQNAITNFVNMLDNIMVGRLGTEAMSGVSIVNQLFFIYALVLFGGFSGAGIFTSQYSGNKDDEGIRNTFRYKFILGIIATVIAFIAVAFFSNQLISLYLHKGSAGDLNLTLEYAKSYIRILAIGFIPYMVVSSFSSTLRECGETIIPLKASFAAVTTNMVFNYLLIYGKFGFPELGVKGAAIATVLSRFVEVTIILIWVVKNKDKYTFIKGLFSTLKLPTDLAKKIFKIGTPLLLNETMWSIGTSLVAQCYSMRGLESVAAYNIESTVYNLFKIVFLGMGNSIGIIVGNLIGAGKMDEAVDTNRKMTAFSVFSSLIMGSLLIAVSPLFPRIYNTSEAVKTMARNMIIIEGIFMASAAFQNASYFTIRIGGKTWLTFMFDGMNIWLFNLSTAYILSRFTNLSTVKMLLCVRLSEIVKVTMGFILVKKKIWLKKIVA